MKRSSSMFRKLLLTLILILGVLVSSVPRAQAAGYPSLTYVRFNRYGGDIYATYCIAADSYEIWWGEDSPAEWDLHTPRFGAINGCTTKYLFSQVRGNEVLYVDFYTYSTSSSMSTKYWFYLRPSGTANLSCELYLANTHLRKDPRLVSNTACAFWDQ